MNSSELREAFLKKVSVRHFTDLEGLSVKITIDRGLPCLPTEYSCVIEDTFYMPPAANKKPVLADENMLYIVFNEDEIGLEMYLKRDLSLHAQILTADSSAYRKARVVFNDVDLGWHDHLGVIQPT